MELGDKKHIGGDYCTESDGAGRWELQPAVQMVELKSMQRKPTQAETASGRTWSVWTTVKRAVDDLNRVAAAEDEKAVAVASDSTADKSEKAEKSEGRETQKA